MAFTGLEDHSITLAEAAALTANYRASVPTGSTLGHYFGGDAISAILAQEGCVGVRIYYGLKDDGTEQLIIVGVDAYENDMTSGLLAEKSILCPNQCGSANVLNSSSS